jgi:hypothetical protein
VSKPFWKNSKNNGTVQTPLGSWHHSRANICCREKGDPKQVVSVGSHLCVWCHSAMFLESRTCKCSRTINPFLVHESFQNLRLFKRTPIKLHYATSLRVILDILHVPKVSTYKTLFSIMSHNVWNMLLCIHVYTRFTSTWLKTHHLLVLTYVTCVYVYIYICICIICVYIYIHKWINIYIYICIHI